MIRYINYKSSQGVETFDEINSKDFESSKAFRKELRSLIMNYNLVQQGCYISTRPTKDWRNR